MHDSRLGCLRVLAGFAMLGPSVAAAQVDEAKTGDIVITGKIGRAHV